MCLSVHRRGGVGFPACITGHMTGGLHPVEGLHPEDLPPWGLAYRGGGQTPELGKQAACILLECILI